MTYLAKPKIHHPSLPVNALGFTRRVYEGPVSSGVGFAGQGAGRGTPRDRRT